MKMHILCKSLICITLIIFLSSCKQEPKQEFSTFSNKSFNNIEKTEGIPLGFKEKLGKPSIFIIVDTLLFIKDKWRDSMVDIYNIKSTKLINSFGLKGKGNGELLSVSSIVYEKTSNSVWLYDITMAKFHRFNLEEICSKKQQYPNKSIAFSNELRGVNNPLFVENNIVCSNILSIDRLLYLDKNGSLSYKKGELPITDKSIPEHINGQAYFSKSVYSEKNKKMVFVYRYADIIELYHSNGELVKAMHGPLVFEPKFTIDKNSNSPRFIQTKDMRFGYLDVTFNSKEIFALFSGKTRVDYPGSANTGEIIYVFNWKGEVIKEILLDRNLLMIYYNESSGSVFGLQINPYPEIYEYKIN